MRTRSRGVPFVSADHYDESTAFVYTYPGFSSFTSELVKSTTGLTAPSSVSSITDDVNPSIEVYVDPITHKWRRVKSQRPKGGRNTNPFDRAFKRCHHVSEKTSFCNDVVISHFRVNSPGNLLFERTDTRTLRFSDGLQVMNWLPGDIADILSSGSPEKTHSYAGHDWFALVDKFNEQCDQFVPSSFLIGEDMAENEIFVDAIRLAINPTRAIQFLLKYAKRLGNPRKHTLGSFAHHMAKESANAHLTFSFGIKPAIDDILRTLDAHSKVSSRMEYLRTNAGLFVPIRAKKDLSSSFDPDPTVNTDPNTIQDGEWRTVKHFSRGVVSGLGRVRNDLSFSNDWSAYLQYFGINKVVGLAWELIPFSFVLDWFTNAQERLNSLSRSHTGGPFVEFKNIGYSVKHEHSEVYYYIPGRDQSFGGNCASPTSATALARRTSVIYDRNPGIPDTSGVLDFSVLGLFHAITGAGLIIQRT